MTVVAFLTGACGGSPGKRASEPREAGVSAHSICDGTLDSSAVQALQRLAGTDRFDEATGTNEAGESRAFSLRNAVRHLHDEYGKRSACWVYRTGDNSGYPLMEIRFSASQSYPSNSAKRSEGGEVSYPLGVFAQVGRTGAELFFKCSSEASSATSYIGDVKYVKGEMYSNAAGLRGDSVDEDRMVILNSVSRAVAEQAGCAPEADLPTAVPSA
ncbi:hypothetical protein [Streptomyces lucensis]|uniref:hypothetical protein n=1 Tax=Streptomyces lucensis TaxID=67319 RepID=UPI00167AE6CC|nr:hypothetical protein [Streptomyces lucensis]